MVIIAKSTFFVNFFLIPLMSYGRMLIWLELDINILTHLKGAAYHFLLAYCPIFYWANGFLV